MCLSACMSVVLPPNGPKITALHHLLQGNPQQRVTFHPLRVWRTKSPAVMWPIYKLKGRDVGKGHHYRAHSSWNKWIKMDCSGLALLNRLQGLFVCIFFFFFTVSWYL